MPCESYKQALSEAAAGAAFSRALRSHLDSCVDCRVTLAKEQSLFASIDAGLRSMANGEVPASLIPTVRSRFEEPAAGRRWLVSPFVPVAAGLVLAFLVAHALRGPTGKSSAPTGTAASSEPPAVVQSPVHAAPLVEPRRPALPRRPSDAGTVAEVLVPHDQEALLISYAEQRRTRRFGELTAALLPNAPLEPLEVAPIQIDELDVKALEDANSR